MRNFTCFILAAFTLSSCASYQYLTLKTDDSIHQNDLHEFVNETDSVKVVYNFNGYGCPVNIAIHNKMSGPLYVDWKRSALISNGKALSYYSSNYNINGLIDGYSLQWTNSFGTQSATLNASVSGQEGIEFIPPQSYITRNPLSVSDIAYNVSEDTAFHKYFVKDNETEFRLKRKEFSESNSPLAFRSYITIISQTGEKQQSIENSFYVKELSYAGYSPKALPASISKRGDIYYVSKGSGGGTGIALAGTLGALIVLAATSNDSESK